MMRYILILIGMLSIQLGAMAQPLEEMEYILRFGIFKGGKANVTAQYEKLNRQKVIHYHLRGRTTGLVDKIYEVNDVYESWVNTENYLPVKSIRNVREQNYRYYEELFFDQVNDSVLSSRSGRKKVPDELNDLVSIFFYVRQFNYFEQMLAGKKIELPVIHSEDLFLMHLEFLGTKTIETKIGLKECYVVSPKVPAGKLLKGSDGLKIYITSDKNRLPIYAEFDLVVGKLKCELNEYKINGVNQLIDQ